MRAASQSVTQMMSRPVSWAYRELRLDLAEELDVVVDVLGVLDLDPGALRERLQGGPVLAVVGDVHVLGPVGEVDLLLLGRVVVGGRRGVPLRFMRRDAAGAQRAETADRERPHAGGAE